MKLLCYTKYAIFFLTLKPAAIRIRAMKTIRFNEKVLQELKSKSPKEWSIHQLYEAIVENWGEEVLDYTTLWRGLKGLIRLGRDKHLYIASALDKTPRQLRKGTNEEEKKSRYTYREGSIYLEYEQTPLNLLTGHLILESDLKTDPESDPPEYGIVSTVAKSQFTQADPNGEIILNDLIQKGILGMNTYGQIYLIRIKGQSVIRPSQLSASNFNEIWDVLERPLFVKWLRAVEGETICYVEKPEGLEEFILSPKAEGTIKKSEFIKADPNGSVIVDELINQGVLEEDGDIKLVRLKRMNSQYIKRPPELANPNFDKIWDTLQQFKYVYFDSTFPHYFKRRGDKKALNVLIQYPKYIALKST